MTAEKESKALELMAEGAGMFNSGSYFEAHEAWERLWRTMPDSAGKKMLQGLIMIAAALHHFKRKEYAGTSKLLGKGLDILRAVGDAGTNLKDFIWDVERFHKKFTATYDIPESEFPRLKLGGWA